MVIYKESDYYAKQELTCQKKINEKLNGLWKPLSVLGEELQQEKDEVVSKRRRK